LPSLSEISEVLTREPKRHAPYPRHDSAKPDRQSVAVSEQLGAAIQHGLHAHPADSRATLANRRIVFAPVETLKRHHQAHAEHPEAALVRVVGWITHELRNRHQVRIPGDHLRNEVDIELLADLAEELSFLA
jgi:hypothetical protein